MASRLVVSGIDRRGALRVRLLGEDLVAFRGESLLGLIAEACPHRRASLYYGRIEPDGLCCAYHGWKFDSAGRCVDMPNEPTDCRFADKVRTVSYPCRERNGIIWAYLGRERNYPRYPSSNGNTQADNIPFFWRSLRYCNWLQALEGDTDSSHINWLHATFDEEDVSTVPGRSVPGFWQTGVRLLRADPAPRIEVVETQYGCLYSARRDHDGEREYHRVHPFLFPFHTMVGAGLKAPRVASMGRLGCLWTMSAPSYSNGSTGRARHGKTVSALILPRCATHGVSDRRQRRLAGPGDFAPIVTRMTF